MRDEIIGMRFAREPEPGEACPPAGVLTPSLVASWAHDCPRCTCKG